MIRVCKKCGIAFKVLYKEQREYCNKCVKNQIIENESDADLNPENTDDYDE